MTILALCREQEWSAERRGYAKAFQARGVQVVCAEEGFPRNGDVRQLIRRCPETPRLILQPETSFPLLPWGLASVEIPTACFQGDTFAYLHRRLRWAALFDYALVFNPEFEGPFRQAGHPRPLALPNAVERDVFDGLELDRTFEVGWVGHIEGSLYKTRRRLLPRLAQQFRMNAWWQWYGYDEMAEVYKRSKIVVNIGRERSSSQHGRFEANFRIFEAMAAGALLITALPNGVTWLGVEPGVHFVGYREERELFELVRHYLAHERERRQIADAGRDKVLREHTYDCRVEALLQRLEADQGRLFAPARHWDEPRVRQAYLDYYGAYGVLGCASQELWKMTRHSPRAALESSPRVMRDSLRAVKEIVKGIPRLAVMHVTRFPWIVAMYRMVTSMPRIGARLRKRVRRIWPLGTVEWVQVRGGAGRGLWIRLDPRMEHAFWVGDYERGVQQAIGTRLKPGDVFYDIGAHIGFFSLIAARLVGPTGAVYAFEPEPLNVSQLAAHVERNAFRTIAIVQAAVYSHAGRVPFQRAPAIYSRATGGIHPLYNVKGPEVEEIEVEALDLDTLVATHRPPTLVKIDVEGDEIEVLKGARTMLAHARPTIICELHTAATQQAFYELLQPLQYQIHVVSRPDRFPCRVLAAP